jgi:Tfp pilus assembly protein PilE
MGQQQLLLVILVTIVVGIATFVAINTFQLAHDESSLDAIRQEIHQAHAQSKVYFLKSTSMGGGSSSYTNITIHDLLLQDENEYAIYSLSETSAKNFTLSYTPHFNNQTYSVTISFDEIFWNGESDEE